ncbi:MAG TPA: helix-turn-helix transcriptional regulator [Pyrinomonadaceae bacterium]|jgi:transcriptional regulator with XRE-family HTH domain|nr:helix-turn-helix transcriptional regulator [Pyrinomonadaceae bacterium]
MGNPRPKPKRLAEKLLQIRNALGLSQTEMHRRLGVEELIEYNQISKYESGRREPSLQVLLQYARAANVYLDAIVDDELDVPERLPSRTKSEGIRRKNAPRRR